MESGDVRQVVELVLREIAETQGFEIPAGPIPDDFRLIGSKSALDSMAFVMVTAGIEQWLAERHDLSITIVSEKAMSMRNSPFRTVEALADYVGELIRETTESAPNPA